MIPKILWQFWHSTAIPDEVRVLSTVWTRMHPEFDHRRYDDRRTEAFITDHHGQRVCQAYRACRLPTMRADLFRYAVLSTMGGYYVDADEYCRVPIDRFCTGTEDFIAYRAPNGYIANSFLACPAGSPIMGEILEQATDNILGQVSPNLWEVTGALVVSRVLARYLEQADVTIRLLPHDDYRRVVAAHPLHCRPESQHWSAVQRHTSIFTTGRGGIDRQVADLTLPPTSRRIKECGSDDPSEYLRSGAHDFRLLNRMLRSTGHYLVAQRRLLELGCGFGRLSRWFLPLARTLELQAGDRDGDAILWCRHHLTHIRFDLLDPETPWSYGRGAFDLVIVQPALALDPPHLLTELARLLPPGGLVLFIAFNAALHHAAKDRFTLLKRTQGDTYHGHDGALLKVAH